MQNIKLTKIQLLTLIALAFVFSIDLFIPLNVAVGVLYIFFLLITGQTKKTILTFSAITSFLVILKLAIYFTPGINWMVFANKRQPAAYTTAIFT